MKKLKINTKQRKYSIYFGSNTISKLDNILKYEHLKFNKCLIVFDSKIKFKYVQKIFNSIKIIDKFKLKIISNEKNKSFKSVNSIIKILLEKNFSRNDCIISIGGGILGDLSSFAASIFKRGTKFINIPSTLLSQVDASIGGKTGINDKRYGKNLIGTFYQPHLVIIDTNFLKTLNDKELICGYAEILKHSLIASKKNFTYLNKFSEKILSLKNPYLTKAIIESCKIKKKVIEEDETEKNLRQILNFGHTFGHAYEAASGFKKTLNHGEGVILGMKSAIKFSLNKKLIKQSTFNKIISHINSVNGNLRLNNFFKKKDIIRIIKFMQSDKKNFSKNINLVLLKEIGTPLVNKQFDESEMKNFFKKELVNL